MTKTITEKIQGLELDIEYSREGKGIAIDDITHKGESVMGIIDDRSFALCERAAIEHAAA